VVAKTAKKETSELWFEEYLRERGLEGGDDHHPNLGPGRRPDYRVSRGADAVICEVKEFTDSKLDRRFREAVRTGQRGFVASSDEQYGSVRKAISRAADQLKDVKDHGEALAIVLANPSGVSVDLDHPTDVIAAMYGNEAVSIAVAPVTGPLPPADPETTFGRDGALTAKHRYLGAVITLHRRTNAKDATETWSKANQHRWAELEDSREATRIVAKAHQEPEYREAAATPGEYYFVHVYSTISSGTGEAVPVPQSIFTGPHDEYWAMSDAGNLELVRGAPREE
jgi:hypothetical protein